MSDTPLLGLAFFLASFSIALICICLCFTVVMRLTRYRDLELIRSGNAAAALVLAAAFAALAIMMRGAIYPATALIQDFWFMADRSSGDFSLMLLRICGNIALTTAVSLGSLVTALTLFQKFTRNIDEEQEIRNGNLAVAILQAGVLIAFAMMTAAGVSDFVNTLIPVKPLH